MSNSIKKILLIINIVILFVVTGFSANKEESYKKLDSYFYLELTPVGINANKDWIDGLQYKDLINFIIAQ